MVEVKKEANNKIVNIDDKKILLGLFAVFLIGSLFSGNLTGQDCTTAWRQRVQFV